MSLDIVFVAYNRLEFTQRSFAFMVENTDWGMVDRLIVYDDGSQPQSRLWLRDACVAFAHCPSEFRTRERRWGSPVGIMLDYLGHEPAELFVKLDNDIAVCPGWLEQMLYVSGQHDVDLLGMEAGMTSGRPDGSTPGFLQARHIGGIGLMRTEAFVQAVKPLRSHGQWYGFTEWQHWNKEHLLIGWITPDLPCPLLDRLPFEPFLSLSQRYRMCGWQRQWGTYDPVWMAWAFDWVREREEAVA